MTKIWACTYLSLVLKLHKNATDLSSPGWYVNIKFICANQK